jgi:hypothetical protein
VIKEGEIVQLLTAHIETDETLRPDELQQARRVARILSPVITRIIRDEIAAARRTAAAKESSAQL